MTSFHRFKAIDWLRGLSVLFMIECHCLYFLTPELERTPAWYELQAINGLVSVAFLFAAGFSTGLITARAAGDAVTRRRRSKRTLLRVAEVVGLSLYIHAANHPVFSQPAWWLRVDILMCISIGLVMLWAVVTGCRGRNGLAAGTLVGLWLVLLFGTFWAAPYRGGEIVTGLLNNSNGSLFPVFPWCGYLLLGGAMGVLASHPTAGRQRLVIGIAFMTGLGLLLTMTPLGPRLWRPFAEAKFETYIVSNTFERLWKLGAVCLALLAISRAAQWTMLARAGSFAVRPAGAVLNYFSRTALSAYFVHLMLLYGFLGLQFTQMWHRRSTWDQYAWRVGVMYVLTAAVCHAMHKARLAIEGMIRTALAARDEPAAIPAT